MLDQESIIANSDLKKIEDGVATVDFTFEQDMPEGTEISFISSMMVQGVETDTTLNATIANETAVLRITNFKVNLAKGTQSIGATYKVRKTPAGGPLQKSLSFDKEMEYRTLSTLVYNRMNEAEGKYGLDFQLVSHPAGEQDKFGVHRLGELNQGEKVSGKVAWQTYSTDRLKKVGAGALFALLVVGGLMLAVRRRR